MPGGAKWYSYFYDSYLSAASRPVPPTRPQGMEQTRVWQRPVFDDDEGTDTKGRNLPLACVPALTSRTWLSVRVSRKLEAGGELVSLFRDQGSLFRKPVNNDAIKILSLFLP